MNTDPTLQAQQAMHMMATMIPIILIFFVFGAAIVIIPYWQIFKKAGMNGALSLLMVIPLVNLIMLYFLGFSQWKVVPAPPLYGIPPQNPQPPSYPPAA